jgi:hypothetical protein
MPSACRSGLGLPPGPGLSEQGRLRLLSVLSGEQLPLILSLSSTKKTATTRGKLLKGLSEHARE